MYGVCLQNNSYSRLVQHLLTAQLLVPFLADVSSGGERHIDNFSFVVFQLCKITDLFDMVRPHMDFTFHCLSSHVNTVYVLCTKPGVTSPRPGQPATPLKLKGEMILLPEVDSLLFVASPVVLNLHELNKKGNFSCPKYETFLFQTKWISYF